MHPICDLDYLQLFQNTMHFELSAIALSIFDQRIVDPCSQSPNMHPPYNTTGEATHIFIFKREAVKNYLADFVR